MQRTGLLLATTLAAGIGSPSLAQDLGPDVSDYEGQGGFAESLSRQFWDNTIACYLDHSGEGFVPYLVDAQTGEPIENETIGSISYTINMGAEYDDPEQMGSCAVTSADDIEMHTAPLYEGDFEVEEEKPRGLTPEMLDYLRENRPSMDA